MSTRIGRREALARVARLTAGTCGLCLSGSLLSQLYGCYRAPGTARDQLIFFSEDTEMKMGVSAYRDVLRQFPLSTNPEVDSMVRRVGERIAAVANRPDYEWEFAVIQDDKIINAFCLPAGKVAFFTGILEQVAQVGALAGAATGKVNPQVAIGLLSAYGVGVSLPFNRAQETEADYIGLRLMAE